jgi:tRNA(Met) C34 N-acetyltransferase TmcA
MRMYVCVSVVSADKTLKSTVALTAGRGRGKSAALGLAIAAAVSSKSALQFALHINCCYNGRLAMAIRIYS